DEVIAGFRGGIREASTQAQLARRGLGADTLVDLEKAKNKVRKEAKPYLQQLTDLKRELREERAARIQNARGGAVFETEIRGRGNTLADRASAKDAELAELERKLDEEAARSTGLRKKIEAEIGAWEGKSAAEAKSTLKVREKAEAERSAKASAE